MSLFSSYSGSWGISFSWVASHLGHLFMLRILIRSSTQCGPGAEVSFWISDGSLRQLFQVLDRVRIITPRTCKGRTIRWAQSCLISKPFSYGLFRPTDRPSKWVFGWTWRDILGNSRQKQTVLLELVLNYIFGPVRKSSFDFIRAGAR